MQAAKQLGPIAVLLKAQVCFKEFWPLCKNLCLEGIGCVRNTALGGIGPCAAHIMNNAPEFSNELIRDLRKFTNSANALHRVVFAAACESLVELVEFEAAFGEDFLRLVADRVAAVRILCARVARKAVKTSARVYWAQIYEMLKHDEDRDVRMQINESEGIGGGIRAGESSHVVLPPLVRIKQREIDFYEAWETNSSGKDFHYLSAEFRPSHLGWVLSPSFTEINSST